MAVEAKALPIVNAALAPDGIEREEMQILDAQIATADPLPFREQWQTDGCVATNNKGKNAVADGTPALAKSRPDDARASAGNNTHLSNHT